MSLPFSVSHCRHRVLGAQVQVLFSDKFILKLTQPEASSLSLALVAVRDGISAERELYMSPIGSDVAFAGTVCDHGINVETPAGTVELSWENVGMLAEHMAAAIGQGNAGIACRTIRAV